MTEDIAKLMRGSLMSMCHFDYGIRVDMYTQANLLSSNSISGDEFLRDSSGDVRFVSRSTSPINFGDIPPPWLIGLIGTLKTLGARFWTPETTL